MRVLILSCSTGGGHNSAGYAVKEQLEEKGHEAVFFDYLTLAGKKVSDNVSNTYIKVVQKTPFLFGIVYKIGAIVSRLMKKSPVYYVNGKMAKYLGKYLEENKFDAIVMPHLYPAETITYMKREGYPLPLTIAVATDYTSIPFWGETDCDYYVIPHEEIKEQFIRAHIPEDKLVAFGIPVSRKFQNKPEKKQARDYLRLSQEGKYVLLIGGSMAAGNMRALLKELIDKSSSEIRIIVICGNNKRLFNRLTRKYRKNERVIIEGNTKQMPLYMSACDLMFSKPGGLTSTEAAVANIPLVHTKPIPGCETKNLRFFVKRQ